MRSIAGDLKEDYRREKKKRKSFRAEKNWGDRS
jgi:hypothetical protein